MSKKAPRHNLTSVVNKSVSSTPAEDTKKVAVLQLPFLFINLFFVKIPKKIQLPTQELCRLTP